MRATFLKPILAMVALLMLSAPVSAQNDVLPYREYSKRTDAAKTVNPLQDDAFGADVSLYNGNTRFHAVDIDVPGNNALPVRLSRTLSIDDRTSPFRPTTGGFADWELDLPHMDGMFSIVNGWKVGAGSGSTLRCSTTSKPAIPGTFDVDEVWHGYNMHIPNNTSETILINNKAGVPQPTDSLSYPWITKSGYRIRCLSSITGGSGEGFLAVAPDGTKYHFTHMVAKTAPGMRNPISTNSVHSIPRNRVFLFATLVQDRHGNTVNYTYSGDKLTQISSSDGRSISLTWSGDLVASATSHSRTWTYTYYATTPATLKQVKLPDNSTWEYSSAGSLEQPETWMPPVEAPTGACLSMQLPEQVYSYIIQHPAGASTTFNFQGKRHYRTRVPFMCNNPPGTVLERLVIPNYSDVISLVSKTRSGQGMPSTTWNYDYGHVTNFGFCYQDPITLVWSCPAPFPLCPTGACPPIDDAKYVTVTEVGGKKMRYTFGTAFDRNDGRLLVEETLSGSTVLQKTTNTFLSDAEVVSQPFAPAIGSNLVTFQPLSTLVRPVRDVTTLRDGMTFESYTNNYDVYSRPTSIRQRSRIGTTVQSVRTALTEYHDHPLTWVVGQVKSREYSGGGGKFVERTFHATSALPISLKRFGHALETYAYHADGTLNTVTDGNGKVTTLSSWYRGVPQSIKYPSTPEASGGATQAATVNARGEITSVTDELGYTTSYGYDLMGRLSSITHPTGDTTSWASTTRNFTQVNVAEFGIPAGHWRLTETTGTHAKDTYYDGLWRPLLTRERDSSNSATTRYVKRAFDHENRETFASYPSTSSSPTTGTWTSYDALGRPTSVSQDSELGLLTTTTQYLSSFGTRTTNPRGFQTTTYYQAFDQPSFDTPTSLSEPGGVSTAITRDVFGKPTAITRSGYWNSTYQSATRHFVYNAQQRLCKRVDPESGATLLDYDAAGNLLWSARSTSLTSTSACQTASVPTNTRSTRSYDARNRLTAITHPAGTASESYSYFADGALHTASTTDGGIWTYAWNKRRLPTAETLTLGAKTFSIGYGYTGLGHVSTLTYPSGLSVSFNPNALGQPQQAGSYATGATYHANGQLAGFTYGNSLIHSQTLNSRGLPNRIRDRISTNLSRLDYTYGYDKHANITSIVDGVDANENRALQYDARDRMTVATAANIYGEEIYDYDILDNVRRMAVYPNGMGGYLQDYRYQYNTSQRLTRIDNETGVQQWGFTHNGLGETLTRAGHDRNWSYQWNAAGRMTQGHLAYGGSTWENYVYDAHGHRTRATRNTGTTRHQIYNRAGQLLYTEDTKDNQRIDYIHLGNKLVAQRSRPLSTSTATITYHHTDAIQSANVETNTAGTQTYRTVRMPYGSPYNGVYREGPGFAGHVTDTQTNLTYMQQRYYDPVALRLLSPDPVDVSTTSGSNFNRYWYANNNPYRFKDPDGRYSCEGSKQDCAKVDQYVSKVRDASRSRDLKPSERAQVRTVSNYLGKKGEGGPKITPTALPKNTKASTDQRGNIKIDVNKNPAGADAVVHGAMALGHEAQHDVDAKASGEAHTRDVATQRERNAYGTEALIGRANGVFLSPATIATAVQGSIENAFGPEPEKPDEYP